MVNRIYVEKKAVAGVEAEALATELANLGAELDSVRIINRYDVEGLTAEQFTEAVSAVLYDPPLDVLYDDLEQAGVDPAVAFAVESLPGQFDQREQSAAEGIQIALECERPRVRYAKVYVLEGEADIDAIKAYLINPVEVRETSHEIPESLEFYAPKPEPVAVIEGFKDLADADLAAFMGEWGLAMDMADVALCRDYFASEDRNPTVAELRVIDTYWSDHCRHTTFNTELESVEFNDPQIELAYQNYLAARADLNRTKPITLMDLGTIGAKVLKAAGKLDRLDESEEVNACTVKIDVTVDGEKQPWLLLFKNETHNHPTEIEPFGGASTCVGGAIRDPLSGRGYVYAAMRISGAGDPRTPLEETVPGRLSQRKIVQTAAAGNSSYGNQIGLSSAMADEIYHPGYVAKHMELGAVMAAVPEAQVRRESPIAGDRVILVGGPTGRDGVGGATGSSKGHTVESLTTAGAEVQKGDAPEERKIQRLFRNPDVACRIKRCNDFGAGGVSVAVGELTDGLDINLDLVPVKYAGLDGTELATSESQERMALVVAADDVDAVIAAAAEENVAATEIATVTDAGRMRMTWRGQTVVDLSRDFLNTNGAPKKIAASVAPAGEWQVHRSGGFAEAMTAMAGDLNVCSKAGMADRFDATAGGETVLMPYGGTYQATPAQAMVHRIPVPGQTDDCSLMAWGFNPYLMESSPYHGAYLSVVESLAKLVATGADYTDVYLSFQEYFEALGADAGKWGKPVAALLGALEAQLQLGVASIGGKDSMSGTFENITVPPTLVSFAVTTGKVDQIVPNQFKAAGNKVTVLRPEEGTGTTAGLPSATSLLANFATVTELLHSGKVVSAYTPGFGGIAEAVMKMAFGERIGFDFADVTTEEICGYAYGSFVLEWAGEPEVGDLLGTTTADGEFRLGGETVALAELWDAYTGTLADVYPMAADAREFGAVQGLTAAEVEALAAEVAPAEGKAGAGETGAGETGEAPMFLIPIFPGTNGEYETERAIKAAGGEVETLVVRDRSAAEVAESAAKLAEAIGRAKALVIPSGSTGGDEPDGAAKFIAAFLRKPAVQAAIEALLARDGLVLGLANGFQALIKVGLLPYGKFTEASADAPSLAVNLIGRAQSRIARVKVTSKLSPWLAGAEGIYNIPVAHREGRLVASPEAITELAKAGQIATQFVDLEGNPSMDFADNPSGSLLAVEGLTSPCGRVFGRMGQSARVSEGLYRNVPGEYDMKIFESAVAYLR